MCKEYLKNSEYGYIFCTQYCTTKYMYFLKWIIFFANNYKKLKNIFYKIFNMFYTLEFKMKLVVIFYIFTYKLLTKKCYNVFLFKQTFFELSSFLMFLWQANIFYKQ